MAEQNGQKEQLPGYNRSKQEPTINYQAGSFETQEFSRGGILQALAFRLTGQLTLAGANNTRAKTLRGDALAVIKRFKVRLNSQENIVDLDGPGIIADNLFLLGSYPRDLVGTLGDGATANPSFDHVFVVAFAVPRRLHRSPYDTGLDLRSNVAGKLEVEVDWNTHTAINADATGFTVTPKILAYSQKNFDSPNPMRPGFLRRYLLQHSLSSTNTKELVRLAPTHSYYGFVLNATDAGADSSAIYNKIRLISGSNVFEDHDPKILQYGYGDLWHGEGRRAFSGAAFGFLDPFISTKWKDQAWHSLRIPFDGNLTEMQPAQGLADFSFEFDATVGAGATLLNIYPYQYVLPPMRG